MSEGPKPFCYFPEDGRVEVGKFHGCGPKQATLPDDERRRVEEAVRRALGDSSLEVRVGEYHCRDCGKWIDLEKGQWSAGMCLSCSMDRASDIFDD